MPLYLAATCNCNQQHEGKWTQKAIEFFNEAAAQGGEHSLAASAAADEGRGDLPVRAHPAGQQQMQHN